MAALYHFPDDLDWEAALIPTEHSVDLEWTTHPRSPSQHPGAWPAAVASAETCPLELCSTAELPPLYDLDLISSSSADATQNPPWLSTYTPSSICLDQPIRTVSSIICPTVGYTDYRFRKSRCSSTLSEGQEANPVSGRTISISGKAKKSEQDVQDTSAEVALGSVERGLDIFICGHCEKSFSTRSTLRSVSLFELLA
jgi:hypothetical protein